MAPDHWTRHCRRGFHNIQQHEHARVYRHRQHGRPDEGQVSSSVPPHGTLFFVAVGCGMAFDCSGCIQSKHPVQLGGVTGCHSVPCTGTSHTTNPRISKHSYLCSGDGAVHASGTFSVQTLLGRRDCETHDLLARQLIAISHSSECSKCAPAHGSRADAIKLCTHLVGCGHA